MNTILKRLISMMLCFVLVLGYVPVSTFATETGEMVTAEVTTKPSTEAIETSAEATEPSTEATEPSTETTEPSAEATEPSTEATEPSTEATEPSTEAAEPSTEATEPSTEATEPSTEATEPSTEATEPEVVAVTGITLDVTTLEVGVGAEPVTLTATVAPENATDKTVTWTSTEEGVASVDENGTLTFGYMGEAVITAKAGEFTATCAVTVGEGEATWYDYSGPAYLDAAIFCSDVHGSSSDLTSVLGGVKTSGVDYSAIGFVGDTCLTVANTTSTVQSALGDTDIEVMFSYAASHDTENSADISTNWNYSGEVEGVSDYYLVYTIRETDMQNSSGASTAAPAFTTWYNGLTDAEKKLPIFIMSHRPLHDRRDDNAGAATWYDAISAAAETSDIVFFWAHNHTSESDVDRAAYYVAKDGDETFTVYNGDTVTPNFTYMNAGYINANNQNPSRLGVATTVRITADSMIFQDYNSSGEYSGTYAHNTTVAREFAASEPEVTLTELLVEGETSYNVGDELALTVQAIYSNDGVQDVTADATFSGYDMSTAGTYTVTVEYGGLTATYEITVNEAATLTAIAVTGTTEYTVGGNGLNLTVTATYDDGTTADVTAETEFTGCDLTASGTYTITASYGGMTDTIDVTVAVYDEYQASEAAIPYGVQAISQGVTAIEVTWDDNADDILSENNVFTDYVVYNLALTNYTEGTNVEYTMPIVENMDTTNLIVYHVADDGTLTSVPCEIVNDCVVFTTNLTGTFAYGSPVVPEGYTIASISIEGIPYDVFVGTSVDLTDSTITATYTKEGAENFVRVLTVYDYDETNFSGFDVNVIGKQTVTFTFDGLSTTFGINVWGETFKDEATGVEVAVANGDSADYGVTAANVAESTNTHVETAVADVMKADTYVAYDITLTLDEGYALTDAEKTVTLPIPSGVSNPVVYYVSDDGATVENMNATKDGNGNVTFTTTHFSTYVVGDSTEITVPDGTTQTVTGTTTTEEKDVYVLVSTPTAGNQYIIASSNSAGTAYALKENTTTGTSVTINAAGNGISAAYIETSDKTIMWNTASGMTFQSENGDYYLRQSDSGGSRSLSFSTSQSTNWTVGTNSLSYKGKQNTYYVSGGSTWSLSRSSANIYFYEKQTVNVTTSANGTYSIAGNPAEVTKVVEEGSTTTLGSTLTFVPESGTTTTTDTSTTATYTVVDGGDPNGIISRIDGNTVTFTGKYGTALVKVSYTKTINGTGYTVDNYITVTATAPVYDIEISQDGTTAANDVIAVRGVTSETELELSYILTYEDADGVQTLTPDSGITWYCYLPGGSSASSIATIDQTGKLTFTGVEGTIKVMVAYEVNNVTVNDIITINVRKSNAVTPSESTTDFPRWPNEGAVRYDKTASAVGNFSETGIAQVELSMAGIPVKTGGAVDVVIMLDMTGSMSDTAMTAAEESAITFAEQIVKNEDGTYNDSRIAILAFNSNSSSPFTYWELGTVDDDDEWSALCTAVRGASEDKYSGGTPYDEALEKCQEILAAAKTDGTGNDRQQFCVFVSDGGPTSYEYITNYDEVKAGTATNYTTSTASATGGSNQSDSNFATIATYTHEYYSTVMKDSGVTMYSVLTGLSAEDYPNCTTILQNIASDSSKAYVVEDGSDTTALTNAFTAIAAEINAAATNVNVEDVITPEYDLIFELPNSNIKGLPDGQEFYLEVVDYPLDEDTHERTGESKILQRIYLATVDGEVTITKITYTDDSGNVVEQTITPVYTAKAKDSDKAYFDANGNYYPEGDGTHHMTSGAYVVLNDDGTLKSLHTVNFTYIVADKKLNWTVTSMSQTSEVALRYFVYLKDSGGVAAENQVAAGTYPTNVYATLNYTNHLGNECEQVFPIPQMTWNGAQVSYVFYLVNENGVPVNRAGREVTFAEVIFVTDIYTYAIVWNDLEQSAGLEASYLAGNLLPSDYELYDENASYKIHVYEDEEGVNLNNHFIIGGTEGDTTTYVYNNKTDITKYNVHGTYAATRTYLCKSYSVEATVEDGKITAATYNKETGETQVLASAMESTTGATIIDGYAYYLDENGKVYTIVQKTDATEVTGFDFANTTVAFAVTWEKKLVPDTVVVDFGLPVDIDVVSNDFVYNYITGIGAKDPGYGINKGYKTDVASLTDQELTIGGHNVSVKNQNNIRFTPGSMVFNKPVEFYYETSVEVYENSQVVPSYMYSSVTVIPATTIYYEDEFVDLKTYTKNEDGTYTETAGWDTNSTAATATQDQDRPGESQISAALDADNNYGYDSAYESMSQYSMGSATKTNVKSGKYATAEFEFYGTGFDIISLTDTTTGTIVIDVYDVNDTLVVSETVDTYYGYKYENDEWVTTTSNDPNALYQVPVMKIGDGKTTGVLTYGKYKAVITATYISFVDHNTTDSGYNFYLDAIRIYNPTGNQDTTANNAYVADGEGYPAYFEVRDEIIAKSTFDSLNDEAISGIVFIDGGIAEPTISDYTNYGPNNELYLACGQAVAFDLNATATNGEVAKIQMAVKTVGGTGEIEVYGIDASNNKTTCLAETINTATDMYYDITALNGKTVVIKNAGTEDDAIVSITNVKVTYTEAQPANDGTSTASEVEETGDTPVIFSIRRSTADAAVASLSVSEETPEETLPEETEPETTVPEETEPETTVPEETEPETTVPKETEPEEDTEEVVNSIVSAVTNIVNTIKNLFSKWFW